MSRLRKQVLAESLTEEYLSLGLAKTKSLIPRLTELFKTKKNSTKMLALYEEMKLLLQNKEKEFTLTVDILNKIFECCIDTQQYKTTVIEI